MAYDKQFYDTKKAKIATKHQQKKDMFINTMFSLAGALQTDLNDLQVEMVEVTKAEEESKKATEAEAEKK